MTSIQESYKLIIILVNNDGHASINGLSNATAAQGYGTRFLFRRDETGQIDGERLPVDLAANATSLGAYVIEVDSIQDLRVALNKAKSADQTTVIKIDVAFAPRVPTYE